MLFCQTDLLEKVVQGRTLTEPRHIDWEQVTLFSRDRDAFCTASSVVCPLPKYRGNIAAPINYMG